MINLNDLYSSLIGGIADIPVPALMALVALASFTVVGMALWVVGLCIGRLEK